MLPGENVYILGFWMVDEVDGIERLYVAGVRQNSRTISSQKAQRFLESFEIVSSEETVSQSSILNPVSCHYESSTGYGYYRWGADFGGAERGPRHYECAITPKCDRLESITLLVSVGYHSALLGIGQAQVQGLRRSLSGHF